MLLSRCVVGGLCDWQLTDASISHLSTRLTSLENLDIRACRQVRPIYAIELLCVYTNTHSFYLWYLERLWRNDSWLNSRWRPELAFSFFSFQHCQVPFWVRVCEWLTGVWSHGSSAGTQLYSAQVALIGRLSVTYWQRVARHCFTRLVYQARDAPSLLTRLVLAVPMYQGTALSPPTSSTVLTVWGVSDQRLIDS